VKDGTKILAAATKWNSAYDVADCFTTEVLPPKKQLTAIVRVGFEEYRNNVWTVSKTSGVEAEETKEITFTTGTAPDYIPSRNIEYAYPVVDQQYFLKDESTKGYVQLEKGQEYLFSSQFKYNLQLTPETGSASTVTFAYNAGERRLNFTIPPTKNSAHYTADFLALAPPSAGAAPKQDKVTTVPLAGADDDDMSMTITEKQASEVVRENIGKVLLSYDFATSRFNTLKDKVNIQGAGLWWMLSDDIIHLIRTDNIREPFDKTELEGSDYSNNQPLIVMEAVLDDYYYNNKIGPLLYHKYPVGGEFRFKNRNTSILGIIPAKAIHVIPAYITKGIANNDGAILNEYYPFYYGLREVYRNDYRDIATQIFDKYVKTNGEIDKLSTALVPIVTFSDAPFFSEGIYNTWVYYRLPDGTRSSPIPFWYRHKF
jgi:hypothetical protein